VLVVNVSVVVVLMVVALVVVASVVVAPVVVAQSTLAAQSHNRSVLQEQEEATKARWYRFLKQSEERKTYPLPGTKENPGRRR